MAESAGLQAYAEPRTMLARARAMKQRIRAGEVVFGAWLSLTDAVAAEIMGRGPEAMKSLLYRARRAIRDRIEGWLEADREV